MVNYSWSTGGPVLYADADRTAFGNGVSAALTAVGCMFLERKLLSDNSDTTWASAPDLYSGQGLYETWKIPNTGGFDDIFFRMDFVRSSYYGNVGWALRVGSTWTGNGDVGGTTVLLGSEWLSSHGTSFTGEWGSWAASDGSGFVLAITPSLPSAKAIIWVDRIRDPSTGTPVLKGGDAVGVQVGKWISTAPLVGHLDLVDGVVSQGSSYPPVVTPGILSTLEGLPDTQGRVQLYPWWSVLPNGTGVTKMVGTINQADYGQGAPVSIGWLPEGTSRMLRPLGPFVPNYSYADSAGSSGASIATWWSD